MTKLSQHQKVKAQYKLDASNKFEHCKDFLCPPESKIQEWFPTELQARLRAQALDPYGLMQINWGKYAQTKDPWLQYLCRNENCHAKLVLRKVDPDQEGNDFGLYGCMSHQHPLTRKNKSEIIFKNKADVDNFFDKDFKSKYRSLMCGFRNLPKNSKGTKNYRLYGCRRKHLKDYGRVDCESKFSIRQSMPFVKDALKGDDRPYSLKGTFYHCHEDDKKFDRDEFGGYFRNGTTKYKKYLRVKNNQVFPLRARKKFTVQEVLDAQKRGRSLTVDDI